MWNRTGRGTRNFTEARDGTNHSQHTETMFRTIESIINVNKTVIATSTFVNKLVFRFQKHPFQRGDLSKNYLFEFASEY